MKKFLPIFALALVVAAPVLAVAPVKTRALAETSTTATERAERAAEIKAKLEELKVASEARKEKIRGEVATKVKARATAELDRIIARYEKISARVENMTVISDERKTALVEKIEAQIEIVKGYKEEVEKATTAAEVKTVMGKIKTELPKTSALVKSIVDEIHATHLEGVIEKLNTIKTKLEAKAGTSTENKELLDAAKKNLEEAQVLIDKKDFKGAKESILAARKNLVDLAQSIKGGTEDSDADTDADKETDTTGTDTNTGTTGTDTTTTTTDGGQE